MRTASTAVLVAMVLWLGGAAAAWADACYQDGLGNLYVLKNFTQPGTPNGCQTINGYIANTACSLSGNACRADDESVVLFQAHNTLVCNMQVSWTIEPLTLTGGLTTCTTSVIDGAISCRSASVEKIPCPTPRPFFSSAPS